MGSTPTDARVVAETAAALRAWVASGACQAASGAFVAWVDLSSGALAHEYPEITGYVLTFLAGLPSLAAHGLAVGRHAAAWLGARARSRTHAARDDWDNDAIYLFDLAVAASGLISFGRHVDDEETVEAGLGLVAFLENELAPAEPIRAVSRRGSPSGRSGWSTSGQAHLAKLTQAFLLAERPAGVECAAHLVETIGELQRSDGRMVTERGAAETMLHPHLYAAEGFWLWASATGDAQALERARSAAQWAFAHQLETGGFPRSVPHSAGAAPPVEQCDVTAQAVRLALLLGLRSEGVGRGIARLVELARGRPALVYQPASQDMHLNTWSTLFAAQSLTLAAPGSPPLSWRQLV